MANCLHDRGELSAAEDLQRDTIARLRAILGRLPSRHAHRSGNLAIVMRAMGREEDAVLLQRQIADALARRSLDESHPSIVALLNWTLVDGELEPQPT